MVEELTAPLRSPLHSPLRSPLRSPLAGKWDAAVGGDFSLDFTTGSTPVEVTATGATNGTRFNSSGVLVAGTAPRLDYNPASPFVSWGIKNEPARTNLALRSEDFSDTGVWTIGTGTSLITANAIAAPDGTTTADLYGAATGTASGETRQGITHAINSTYTSSIYAKINTGRWLRIRCLANATSEGWFDVTNGVVGTAINCTLSMVAGSSGWYRCILVFPTTGVISNNLLDVGVSNADNTRATTSGQNMYWWGYQHELGTYASSYVPTVASTVTRAADVLKFTPPAGVTNVRYTYQDNSTADAVVTPEVEVTITNGQLGIKTITDVTA
jgi:hypothetical protein